MKNFLVLTTLLIATATNASDLTLGMANTICEGTGVLTNRSAPDFQFKSERRFYNGFAHIKTTINVLGLNLSSNTGLVVKQSGSLVAVFDPVKLKGDFFEQSGSGECNSSSCTYKAYAKGGDLLLQETILPTAEGFKVTGRQKRFGVFGTYQASFTCKPLVQRNFLPDLINELRAKLGR